MSWTVQFALIALIPLVALAFLAFAPARAVLVSFLGGWMFLPVPGIEVLSFDYDKRTAVPLVVFMAVCVFDGARLARLRFSVVDLPLVVFCVAPMATSLANGLGAYDALTSTAYQWIHWGLPYLIGRIYFSSVAGLRQLAVGLFAAGVVYAPLCLWEIRMSPQLHASLYGVHQHEWVQTLRSGGYRPMVFLQHGLDLGLWMCAASISGIALWSSGAMQRLWGIPLALLVPLVILTTVLGKSFGAIALLVFGALVLFVMRFGRTSLPMAFLVLVPTGYVAARTSGQWTGEELISLVSDVSPERAHSLAFRIEAEEQLRVRAAERPVFGWGGFGRSFTRRFDDPTRTENATTDSLWIIVFGKYGVTGLASLLLLFCTPILVLWRRCPPVSWYRPSAVGAWALALVLTLYSIDCLLNAMLNPIYLLVAGGLCGLSPRAAPLPARGQDRHRALQPPLARLA